METLTEKELGTISELLTIEENVILKFNSYAEQCEDPEMKAKFQQASAKHVQHFDTLLKQLG